LKQETATDVVIQRSIFYPHHPTKSWNGNAHATARTHRPAPRWSEYVKTLFTMSNNRTRAHNTLTTANTPCARPIPGLLNS